MKKRVVALMVMAVLAGVAFVPAAVAAPPVPVEGKWELEDQFIPGKFVGGNQFFTGEGVTVGNGWSGDFRGTSVDYFSSVAHKNGVVNARFTVYFSGTVLGSQFGTMVLEMGLVYTTTGRMGGSWVIKSAEGGLAGLHGAGEWWIDWDPVASYSGKVHW